MIHIQNQVPTLPYLLPLIPLTIDSKIESVKEKQYELWINWRKARPFLF